MESIDQFGEVFTPLSLVDEMLDTIPITFWSDPTKRIIDNSCGEGVFLIAIKNRLLKYHTEEHILSNMLYGIDIQEKNIIKTREKLSCKHLVCADALQFDHWGKKFDLVVGNPPYNKAKTGKKGNVCNPLWCDFVSLAINTLLSEKGYLLFVHPPLYRKVGHKLWEIMKNGSFKKITILSTNISSKIFNCMTKVDWYLWQNNIHEKTIIIDEKQLTSEIDLKDKSFLPNFNIFQVYENFNSNQEIIYNCNYHHYTHKDYLSVIETNEYKYPCVYLINKKGVTYYYSKRNDLGHFGVPKVIISMGTGLAILDKDGKYGMCEISFGIPIKNESEGTKLVEKINSSEFQKLLLACKWKTVQIDYKLFKYLNINI
jgi:Fe-S cluster biosynthesis and repair protein YggX